MPVLRPGGIYRWADRELVAVDLGPEWRVRGLMGHPFLKRAEDINYIRIAGAIINVYFRRVGHMTELIDTGQTLEGEPDGAP